MRRTRLLTFTAVLALLPAMLAGCAGTTPTPMATPTPTPTAAPTIATTPEPAAFRVRSLLAAPLEVEVGERISVLATVANVGVADGAYTATLTVGGQAVQTQEVPLAAGASKNVWFELTQGMEGTYEIALGSLTAVVKVWPSAVEMQLAQAIDIVSDNVIQLRKLEPLRQVDRDFMNHSELEALLIEKLEEEAREDILKSEKVLAILGLIPEDLDLYQLYLDLLTEQIIGLYDLPTEKLYVIRENEDFGPLEETVLAHEYVHALQQQHFDIHALTEKVRDDSEASAALSALIEGDAYNRTFEYMNTFLTQQELTEIMLGGQDIPILEQAPYAIQRIFLFPVLEGTQFVAALTLNEVNDAFGSPPVSTEQILHPRKYFDGEKPIPTFLPDLVAALGPGWSQIDSDVLGEFSLMVYLESGTLRPVVAANAAAGWGGDRYVLLQGPQGEQVFVSLTTWDTQRDAEVFGGVALSPLFDAPFQKFAGIKGNQVFFVLAPSNELVEAVRLEFPGFLGQR